MKVAILHLSDLHLRESGNRLLERIDAIRGAAQSAAPLADGFIIVVTGDIAFSGTDAEYGQAKIFIAELHRTLAIYGMPVYEIFVPGNHDCDFNKYEKRKGLRDLAIREICIGDSKIDESLIDECAMVQEGFFTFVSTWSIEAVAPKGMSVLLTIRDITLGDKTLVFRCFNTAWMSQIDETQGQLLFPDTGGMEALRIEGDLVVSLFHHPYPWLQADNSRQFRNLIDRSSDLVLTGHEHDGRHYTKRVGGNMTLEYVEGGVLQKHAQAEESSFNIIVYDFDDQQYKIQQYLWDGELYAPTSDGDWRSFDRAKRLMVKGFELSRDFQAVLLDSGAGFTHPAKARLTLEDIFQYPDIDVFQYEQANQHESDPRLIRSEGVSTFLADQAHILILGAEKSGKSALARSLYLQFYRTERLPVLLRASDVSRFGGRVRLDKLVDDAVEEQYHASRVEAYRQLDRAARILIIDDFDECGLNAYGQDEFLREAEQQFSKVFVFADDTFQLQEITERDGDTDRLLTIPRCGIRQFGCAMRWQLIDRWFNIGRDYSTVDTEIDQKVREVDGIVVTLLGKNLLPSYPIFILSILQMYEAHTGHTTASGAYGYYYEALITIALTKFVGTISLDTLYTCIASIAFHIFQHNPVDKTITYEQLDAVVRAYQTEYQISFRQEHLLTILQSSQILKPVADGFRFSYKYIYYYFVAKYIAINLRERDQEVQLRGSIVEMAEKLFVSDNANITIFLVYLTKDEETIRLVLQQAKCMFADVPPCEMSNNIAFINRLIKEQPPVALPDGSGSARDHRIAVKRRFDDIQEITADECDDDQREFDHALSMNNAFKTMQILGQVLRNFPGALRGELKVAIANETYNLGLRTLQFVLSLFHDNIEDLTNFIKRFLQEQHHIKDEKDLTSKTDKILYLLGVSACYGVIKKVSNAVGSRYLEETYTGVDHSHTPTSMALIDLAIRLDHFVGFPDKRILALNDEFEKNLIAQQLLRYLVRDYLHLYPIRREERQAICDKLGIRYNTPRMITTAVNNI